MSAVPNDPSGTHPAAGGEGDSPTAGRLVVLGGPTAVGKTGLSLRLAGELNGEIVSADSMQVYRGMDIGTAKASAAERRRVPHHLLDVRDPDQPMNVAEYQELARRAIHEIHQRGRLPLLVGGTGLYIRAVIQDYRFGEAEPDHELRRRLKADAEREGRQSLHQRLAAVDPETAAKTHPNDLRRTIRALEYYLATGQPLSAKEQKETRFVYDHLTFILNRSRAGIYDRINRRAEAMLEQGFLDEVRALLEVYDPDLAPLQGLGYGHMAAHLLEREPMAESLRRFKRDTRRFAKRQLTWFRREEPAVWITLDSGMQTALKVIMDRISSAWPDMLH